MNNLLILNDIVTTDLEIFLKLSVITAFHQVATFGQTAEEAPPQGNGKRVRSHSDVLLE